MYLLAKISFDTAENEPLKVCEKLAESQNKNQKKTQARTRSRCSSRSFRTSWSCCTPRRRSRTSTCRISTGQLIDFQSEERRVFFPIDYRIVVHYTISISQTSNAEKKDRTRCSCSFPFFRFFRLLDRTCQETFVASRGKSEELCFQYSYPRLKKNAAQRLRSVCFFHRVKKDQILAPVEVKWLGGGSEGEEPRTFREGPALRLFQDQGPAQVPLRQFQKKTFLIDFSCKL